MKKIFFFIGLMFLGALELEANIDIKIYTDVRFERELLSIENLNKKSAYLREKRKFNEEISIHQQIIDIYSDRVRFAKFVAFAYVSKAVAFMNLKNDEKALETFETFRQNFISYSYNDSYKELISYSYAMSSDIYQKQKEYQKAIDKNYELLLWAENNDIKKIKGTEIRYEVFYNIGYLYSFLPNFKKSLESYEVVIKELKDRNKMEKILSTSLINKFELNLIMGVNFIDEYEFFISKYEVQEDFLKFGEFLKILFNAQTKPQTLEIENWKKKNKGQILTEWSFVLIDNWIKNMPKSKEKDRVQKIVEFFKTYLPTPKWKIK